MSNLLTFNSGYTLLPSQLPDFDPLEIEQEPQFFSADIAHAYYHGGPITRAFIKALPPEWAGDPSVILDSRTHMLMKGWLPAIPGWHLDDIPRDTRQDGQPDHANPSYRAEHILALVGDCSRTEFAIGTLVLPDVEDGDFMPAGTCPETSIYGLWHKRIERGIADDAKYNIGELRGEFAPERRLIHFNDQAFHRATEATHAGWRWFARVSRGSRRQVLNKIRTQTQVYLPTPNAGW